MKNRRNIIIAALLGIFAVIAHQLYINNKIESIVGPYEKFTVVMATTQILMNTRIEANMVTVQEVPKKFVQPGTLQKVDEVVGQLASATIDEGEQILKNKLIKFDDAYLALRIPSGKRAVTIPVSDVTGVAGLLRPGNYVDILGIFDFAKDVQKADKRIRTMFQGVLVLAVGRDFKFINDPLGLASGKEPKEESVNSGSVRNVTVALTPRQSQVVVLAREIGLLSLTLRPHFGESEEIDIPDDDTNTVTNTKESIKAIRKAPYLEIRGAQNIGEGY